MRFKSWLLAVFTMASMSIAAGEIHFTHKGVAYVSFWHDEYVHANSGLALNDLHARGANWASLLATWYMPLPTSNTIQPNAMKTPSDAGVRQAIRDLKARGLKVMLKPHVDVDDGSWRGTINPGNTTTWFASYNTFITHYAQIAKDEGVDLFCIGCEFRTMSNRLLPNWTTVINNIKAIYTGPLTYAANSNATTDEIFNVVFWPQLNFIGADFYVALTGINNPTLAQLKAGWTSNRYGEDMLTALKNFQASRNMPMIFTEIGYQSSDGTNTQPNGVPTPSTYDAQEHADCYQAAFEVLNSETWLSGVFWWGWEAQPIDPLTDKHFSARGKPAATILRTWYGTPVNPPQQPPGNPPTDPPPNNPGDPNTPPNQAPVILSGPTASLPETQAGTPIAFTLSASDPDQDTLTILWDFGDGTSTTDFAPLKSFSSAGIYLITATVNDGRGGTATAQTTVAIFAELHALEAESFSVTLNFKKHDSDSLQLSGRITRLTAFNFREQPVSVDIGGILRTFTTNAMGKGYSTDKKSVFTGNLRVAKQGAPFSVKISAADLSALSTHGFINADIKKRALTVPVRLIVGDMLFAGDAATNYAARVGKFGSSK